MKRLMVLATLAALMGGCTEDTRVLVGDVGDHLSHDILDTVFGILFPASERPEATPAAAPAEAEPG